MKLASQNIRSQIFLGFLALIALLFFNLWISYWFLQKQEKINQQKELLQEVETDMLKLYNEQLFFIENNFLDSNFYIKKNTYEPFLFQERSHYSLSNRINKLINSEVLNNADYKREINLLSSEIDSVQSIFSQLITLQLQKGFKNWGTIGKMREFAHILESNQLIQNEILLKLRRHEKDFLLRKEIKYYTALLNLYKGLNIQSAQTRKNLNKYVSHFEEVVYLDEKLGDFYNGGLKLELLSKINTTTSNFDKLISLYKTKQQEIIINIRWQLIISGIFITITSLLIALIISNKISKPLKLLIYEVNNILKEEKVFHFKSNHYRTYREITDLVIAFNHLMNKINSQITEINKSSQQLIQQNDELTKVNQELDQFVYSASHDLRSPLTTILGLINLLKFEREQNSREEYLSRIETLIRRLDNFIIDILNLSRNSRLDLEFTNVELESMVKEILDSYDYHENIKIEKEVILEKNTHTFYSDKTRIKIILNNLISNSIKYSNKFAEVPYVKVVLNIDRDRAFIKIIDNGIGIRKEYKSKIFDMFFRANDVVKGSGLGLYIVKECLSKLNGSINFESKLGNGTTFKVVIPNHLKLLKIKDSSYKIYSS